MKQMSEAQERHFKSKTKTCQELLVAAFKLQPVKLIYRLSLTSSFHPYSTSVDWDHFDPVKWKKAPVSVNRLKKSISALIIHIILQYMHWVRGLPFNNKRSWGTRTCLWSVKATGGIPRTDSVCNSIRWLRWISLLFLLFLQLYKPSLQ